MKIGPKYKICRRLGSRVFGKCQTTKFTISGSARGGFKTGRRPRALSDYGAQLIEKQKARYTYGLKERQFAAYVAKARLASRTQNPAATLYQKLESRLDNVAFRLGLAPSRAAARQLVTHGHLTVNGRRLTIPSYEVKTGDRVAPRPESLGLGVFRDWSEKEKKESGPGLPVWLSFDSKTRTGEKAADPPLGAAEQDLNFGSILEFYSRV